MSKIKTISIFLVLVFVLSACGVPVKGTSGVENKPSLADTSITVMVDHSKVVEIQNVDTSRILTLNVVSEDSTIARVKKKGKTAFKVTGVDPYEETDVSVLLELEGDEQTGKSSFLYYLKVYVEPDRQLAPKGKKGRAPDYSDKSDWVHLPKHANKPVDTFFIYSTQYDNPAKNAPVLAPMDDPSHRKNAKRYYRYQRSIFEDMTNIYMPYYRQTNMHEYFGEAGEDPIHFQRYEQKKDIFDALDYYFEHYNKGRPFIVAGHSQGAMMTLIILEDYMKRHPEYYERMVAAYVIGFSVTKEDLKRYPHIKFAERARDTGVVVSWNTEGKGNKGQRNFVVPKGSIAINPINWKRDETYAPASENLGSRVYDPGTRKYSIRKNWGDAQVDTKRGVVITHTKFLSSSKTELYGTQAYHSKDISLYYKNLIRNIRDRIRSYVSSSKN